MKSTKFFIVFTFLLAFAFSVSAQGKPAWIVWENLQEKYESFYDIKPTIYNLTGKTLYYDNADCAVPLTLWGLDENNHFIPVSSWRLEKDCEVKLIKMNPFNRQTFHLSKEIWDKITTGDSTHRGFKLLPAYNGKGRYMLSFNYVVKKVKPRLYYDAAGYVTSPVFEVIEKDFKK